MGRRLFRTEADIARFQKEGYGQGEGSSYRPWIRVQDVPSIGRSRKTPGIKSGRLHHFLSDLEYHYFLILEFSDQVLDIREQYPLFATTRARDIAADMGIQYPRFFGTQLPFVLTSDFVVTLGTSDGKRRLAIRTCKYEVEVADPNRGIGTIEKLDLERAIWADQSFTDWKIVTEKLASSTLSDNLEWLHKAALTRFIAIDAYRQSKFIEIVVQNADGVRTLSSIVRSAASAVSMPYRDATQFFRQLMWKKLIRADLVSDRLDLTLPSPRLSVAAAIRVSERAA